MSSGDVADMVLRRDVSRRSPANPSIRPTNRGVERPRAFLPLRSEKIRDLQRRWIEAEVDGKELFYVTGEAVVAVSLRPDGSFGTPRRLFDRSNFLLNDYRFQRYQALPTARVS